jgi:hypothetical protein
MHLYSLSITNLIPYSATDLSQWHRAHDWLHAAPRGETWYYLILVSVYMQLMMTYMQGQLMRLHSLNITNQIQSSATDLSQWHRAHDWLHAAPRVSLVADKRKNELPGSWLITCSNTWDSCLVTCSSMMTYMQGQLMQLHSLSITNLIQFSATELSHWHRAHDWLHAAPRVSLVADKRKDELPGSWRITCSNTWDSCL